MHISKIIKMTKTLKELTENIHWHFQVVAYEKRLKTGILEEATEIEIVEVNTEEEAIELAKQKIKRPNYFLRKAWQCRQCEFQRELLKSFQKLHE